MTISFGWMATLVIFASMLPILGAMAYFVREDWRCVQVSGTSMGQALLFAVLPADLLFATVARYSWTARPEWWPNGSSDANLTLQSLMLVALNVMLGIVLIVVWPRQKPRQLQTI